MQKNQQSWMVLVEREGWYPDPVRIEARIVGSKAIAESLTMNNKKKRMGMDSHLKSEELGWGLVDGLVLSQSWRIFFFVVVVFFLNVRCVVDVVYRVRAEREG
ncbi:hypothetical protein K457DRAFT_177166 [Linnemannia elongata AG-77]|uniref:Uncharacterized protein n=1 Tax=Linnemannia elongata AG-77 TaxID=1314771 RepID=A0A197KJD6_9FUNG|nr:hypothetical protein K457DRAFT_177166 [Linnemannia elongata AG-77]